MSMTDQPINPNKEKFIEAFGRVTTPAFPKRSPSPGRRSRSGTHSAQSVPRGNHAKRRLAGLSIEPHQAAAFAPTPYRSANRRVDDAKRD